MLVAALYGVYQCYSEILCHIAEILTVLLGCLCLCVFTGSWQRWVRTLTCEHCERWECWDPWNSCQESPVSHSFGIWRYYDFKGEILLQTSWFVQSTKQLSKLLLCCDLCIEIKGQGYIHLTFRFFCPLLWYFDIFFSSLVYIYSNNLSFHSYSLNFNSLWNEERAPQTFSTSLLL